LTCLVQTEMERHFKAPQQFISDMLLHFSSPNDATFKRRRYIRAAVIHDCNHCASFHIKLIALDGDVSSNPGPLARNDTTNGNSTISNNSHPTFLIKSKGLKVCHLNVRSLPRHLEEVKTLMNLNDHDVFAMSETWLNSTWSDCAIASMKLSDSPL